MLTEIDRKEAAIWANRFGDYLIASRFRGVAWEGSPICCPDPRAAAWHCADLLRERLGEGVDIVVQIAFGRWGVGVEFGGDYWARRPR